MGKTTEKKKYFVVRERAVPEVLLKVVQAKKSLDSEKVSTVQEAAEQIKISFCKVAAHTGNHYNEEADQLAKSALLRTDENVSI